MAKRVGRPRKFPKPKPNTFPNKAYCVPWDDDTEALYREKTGLDAIKQAKEVNKWFRDQAIGAGWSAIVPMKAASNSNGAGWVVWIDKAIAAAEATKPPSHLRNPPSRLPSPRTSSSNWNLRTTARRLTTTCETSYPNVRGRSQISAL